MNGAKASTPNSGKNGAGIPSKPGAGAEKILMVDDEVYILEAYERNLTDFNLVTAIGAGRALDELEHRGPFAVVVADLRMPGINGINLLKEIRARWPATTRIMLTGSSDHHTADVAMTEGEVFRFLVKPCPMADLKRALEEAMAHHRANCAENR